MIQPSHKLAQSRLYTAKVPTAISHEIVSTRTPQREEEAGPGATYWIL